MRDKIREKRPSMRDFLYLCNFQYHILMIDQTLIAYMKEMLRNTPDRFRRYMFNRIDWNARMVGIIGPRGVGKSTMILQKIREGQDSLYPQLYVSADHTFFSTHTLTELADNFVKEGGKHLYIDEVHKYQGWSRELKQIYDVHPTLKVVFTGSSVLDIQKGEADLSRRALMYSMQGLSFREYLELFHGIVTPVYSLDDIITHRVELLEPEHPLPLFRNYCKNGYYPFSLEGNFEIRMEQVVSQTIEADIPQYADLKAATARKLKKMLAIIAKSAPFKPSYEHLATEIGVSKNNIPDYLLYLERAGMIGQLRNETGGMRSLGKIEKVFVDNPSLMSAIADTMANVGTLRETFFYNQMRVDYDVTSSKHADFEVNGYTFEVGGRKKGTKQIEGVENAFIVKDDIETGYGIFLPLWTFGLTY